MKHKGSRMDFAQERSDDLMRAYDKYIAECKTIKIQEVCKHIVNMPAKRFWVSENRAAMVISAMMLGKTGENSKYANIKRMCKTKLEMYEEIYRRVMELKQKFPNKRISELCAIVVAQPAPKFYLTPGSARTFTYIAKKEWIARKQRKLRRFASQ